MKLYNSIYKVFAVVLLIFSFTIILFFLNRTYLEKRVFIEWEIFFIRGNSIVISLILDWIRYSFIIIVRLISGFIIIYSIYYIEGDKNFIRFMFILLIFVSSIIFLIIRPNLISLLLGWDGLGLTRYALVIYYQRESSNNSGIITVLRNRVGDSSLLVVIGSCIYLGGWNFLFFSNLDKFLCFIIILGAITKRAQIPFSAWLPAAIAAPTPVSALVHSSTLVTAGVYLIIRFNALIIRKNLGFFLFCLGVLTILIAGFVANYEIDLKKVVALSTLRQLGVIIIVLGAGKPILAFFHLVIHALFKSTLFICAGFLIHNLKGSQDRRFRSLFGIRSPFLGVVFGCTNLALCGFPFIAGFFSKDTILEEIFTRNYSNFIVLLIIVATGLTVSYRLRVIYFSRGINSKINRLIFSSDFNIILIMRRFFLFIISVIGGFILSWLIIPLGFVFITFIFEKFFILIVVLTFLIFITTKILPKPVFNIFNKNIWPFSLIIFLPKISSYPLNNIFLSKGLEMVKLIDKGWYEYAGPIGVTKYFSTKSFNLQNSQNVLVVRQYFIRFLVFIFIILFLYYLESSKSFALKKQRCIITLNKTRFKPIFNPKLNVISTFVLFLNFIIFTLKK